MGRVGTLPRSGSDRFYVQMAVACVAVAFLGFAPTYWLPVARGSFQANPIVHVHGLVFSAWTIFFAYQTWLGATGRLVRHRSVGPIGVSLATAMTILGVLAAINQMKTTVALGLPEAGKAFALVPLSSIVFFAVLVAIAIGSARRREWHKRLMLVATISILDAAVARWFLVFLAPPGAAAAPPPVMADVPPALLTCLLVLVAIVRDWRAVGRPHPAYLLGGGVLLGLKIVQVPLSAMEAWRRVAGGVLALMG
jgi:hypothetical protein